MTGKNKVDEIEKEKRIYQVSLLLRRKPISFIREYMVKNWGIKQTQTYRYIALARKEWQKYSTNLKKSGIGYYMAKLRDLTDQAYTQNDLRLIFDVTKEEAKLMGIYPSEKYRVEIEEIIVKRPKEENINDSESGKS